MFIKEETIENLKKTYGTPELVKFDIPVLLEEFNRIKSSQRDGRRHDVTLYIKKDDRIVVIAKHFYPKGMYRAPSGGIHKGEDFIEGTKREALEETGCEIELEKFLLITDVDFYLIDNPEKKIKWHSYIFQAKYLSGDFKFTDTHEIKEVKLAKLEDFNKFSLIMRSSKIGGLHYRAALHDAVKRLLDD